MSGSVKELIDAFSKNKAVTYMNRDGKITSAVLEAPLVEAATKFCEKKGLSRNEFFRMMEAIAPDNISVTKTMRIILSRLYFTGDLDIHA